VLGPLLEGVLPGALPEEPFEFLAAMVVGRLPVGHVDGVVLAAGLRATERRRVRNLGVERRVRREVGSVDVSSPPSPES